MSSSDETTVEINEDKTRVLINWNKAHSSRVSVKWLRFNCKCGACVRYFDGSENAARAVQVTNAKIVGKDLCCNIEHELDEGHITKLPLDFILNHCNCDFCMDTRNRERDFKLNSPKEKVPYVKYESTLTDMGLFRCIQWVMDRGFCVIENFPTRKEEFLDFANSTIGPRRATAFGETFDVKDQSKPLDPAYTTYKLPFHQDQPYFEICGVQLLLTIKFDDTIKGGRTKMTDLFRCADILRKEHPEHFETLCRVPATFGLKSPAVPAWFEKSKPHIQLDYFGKIVSINWSPHKEDTLRVRDEDVDSYYEAYKIFFDIIHDEENQTVFRLKPGDLLIMNNQRMGHSREAFNSLEGERYLLGTYTDLDHLKSHYMTLGDKLGIEVVPPKVGNGCSN